MVSQPLAARRGPVDPLGTEHPPGFEASGCGPSDRFSRRPGRERFLVLRGSSQCMGRDSVELVRRAYLAWQEGDLEELVSLLDPQVSWSPVLRFLEGHRPAVGHRAVRRWFRWIRITYRSIEPLPRRFEDHGHRVLVLGRLVGGSRLGEGDLDVPVAWVWTVRGERIAAMRAFRDERTARQAIRAPD
jgi:ketosteroid isomerase-like protein